MNNPLIAKHGITVLRGLERALKNMDDIKNTYAELSILHSEKLRVDPDNFKVRYKSFFARVQSKAYYVITPLDQATPKYILNISLLLWFDLFYSCCLTV